MGRLRNYLRVQRRTWHLTQEEMAFLLGYLNQSIIGRLEREERAVTLAVAHACEVVFGIGLRDLYPALLESVEQRTLGRLLELRERIAKATSSEKTLAKLKLLQQAIRRLEAIQEQKA